jgi:hypothetical protein
MPRFVLLYHDCPEDSPRPSHCDLMLEADGSLRTWAITELPCSWRATLGAIAGSNRREGKAPAEPAAIAFTSEQALIAERLADHRLAYLVYEGPISNNRGTVRRLDFGTYSTIEEFADRWIVNLAGHSIRGRLSLLRYPGEGEKWDLDFRADE